MVMRNVARTFYNSLLEFLSAMKTVTDDWPFRQTPFIREVMDSPPKRRRCLSDPKEELERTVHLLMADKSSRHFPLECASVFDGTIRPFIDQHGCRDGMVLPASTAIGKKLRQVLVLAIAVQRHGIDLLVEARSGLDKMKVSRFKAPTKDWVSFLYWSLRQESPLFNGIKTTSWTQTKALFIVASKLNERRVDQQNILALEENPTATDDDILSIPDSVVPCFQECDVVSITSTEMKKRDDTYTEGFICDVCAVEYSDCDLCFYHCQKHLYDYCATCVERAVNFK